MNSLVSPSFWVNLIKQKFFYENEEYDRPDNRISVTEISGCLRRAYYDRVSPLERGDKDYLQMFYGRSVHFFVQQAILSQFPDVKVENKVMYTFDKYGSDITVVGKIDILYQDIPIELKTTDKLPDSPIQAHELQLRFYLAILRTADIVPGYGLLVYFNRDRVRVFSVREKERDRELMESRAGRLRIALEQGRPPRPEPDKAYPYCSYCPYFITGKCKPFEK